jgi:hypothetical protein
VKQNKCNVANDDDKEYEIVDGYKKKVASYKVKLIRENSKGFMEQEKIGRSSEHIHCLQAGFVGSVLSKDYKV